MALFTPELTAASLWLPPVSFTPNVTFSPYYRREGGQDDEETSQYRIRDGQHVPHKRRFHSTITQFMGRRGQGKTLAMTAVLRAQHDRFAAARYPWKIFTNYILYFPGHTVNEDGEVPAGCPWDLERVYWGEAIHYRFCGKAVLYRYPGDQGGPSGFYDHPDLAERTICGLDMGARAPVGDEGPSEPVDCPKCLTEAWLDSAPGETLEERERCTVQVIPHPKLLDAMLQYPPEAREMTLGIDELQTSFPGRRSLARINLDFSNLLTQIRKRKTECLFTTQFPQVLDVQVLLQIDIFVRCTMSQERRAIALEHYDYWGQITGNDYRKRWPPQPGTQDWESLIGNVDRVWDMYNSDQVIPPAWFHNREKILAKQGWHFDSYEDIAGDSGRKHVEPPSDLPPPYEDSPAEQAKADGVVSLGPEERRLKIELVNLGEAFRLADQMRLAQRHIPEKVKGVKAFAEWLVGAGFGIFADDRDGSLWARPEEGE